MPTFYIDTENFLTATAVYSNSALTTKAADGYYRLDGSYYRQQSGGVLLPSTSCPLPPIAPGEIITTPPNLGVYRLRVDVGTATGMMVLKVARSEDFILPKLIYDGVTYDRYYCTDTGTPGIYFGGLYDNQAVTGPTPQPCTWSTPNPKDLPEWDYNKTTSAWVDTGMTSREWGNGGALSVDSSYDIFLHVFKSSATPTYVDVEVSKYCDSGTMDLSLEISTSLTPISNHTTVLETDTAACAHSEFGVGYLHNGVGVDPTPGDFLFLDTNGFPLMETSPTPGFQNPFYFKIQAGNKLVAFTNGRVVSVTTCP